MLKGKTVSDICMICRSGGGFILDGNDYSASDLCMIGRSLTPEGRIQVENSGRFSSSDLAMITRSAPGRFVFS